MNFFVRYWYANKLCLGNLSNDTCKFGVIYKQWKIESGEEAYLMISIAGIVSLFFIKHYVYDFFVNKCSNL